MKPHEAYIRYQLRVRDHLRPNEGITLEGQLAEKILHYVEEHPGLVRVKKMFDELHAYRYGARMPRWVVDGLCAEDKLERVFRGQEGKQKAEYVRKKQA